MRGATGNNLQNVTLSLPLGLFIAITGVSGSGKSTLINGTLMPIAARELNRATTLTAAPYEKIEGLDQLDKVIDIDQSPIGRTPRSNPATYTGIFTPIRELFAGTQEARSRGYKPGRFSFNVKGGRCEACQGEGMIKVEMHFLPDIYVPCDVCKGKRYNRETLDIHYKGKTIHEVLAMTVEDALEFLARYRPLPVACKPCWMWDSPISAWGRAQRPFPAAKRSGLNSPVNWPSEIPVRRYISWMSQPPACTLKIFANC
ncbi:hypothetical protein HORIV_01720 [Vreelandella olivaria]|uniref:UvrABC system protein A n=1 Tax=Vreelandella olivaria TaxID=390919 RepID=A0ABN5WL58_9GAMM|nr:hypothetical protein HORIV_01720 [Halomonas olivaria]